MDPYIPRKRPSRTLPSRLTGQKPDTLVYETFEGTMYRSTFDLSAFATEHGYDLRGLENLGAMGTHQFSENELARIIELNPRKSILVVDLRQEFHGFVNGNPISWFAVDNHNWGTVDKPWAQISALEVQAIHELVTGHTGPLHIPSRRAIKSGILNAPDMIIDDVALAKFETERQLVERLGGKYFRFPIPDHARPSDSEIDVLVTLLREVGVDKDTTILFHCHGGLGRTTLAMTMLDMLANARYVAPSDIKRRHIKLRGRPENNPSQPGKEYKVHLVSEKADLLREFALYAQSVPLGCEGASGQWSQWLEMQESL